jgi:hypothetical protein
MTVPSPSVYTIGTVVSATDVHGDLKLGHIVGFTRNAIGEVILKVQWDTEETTSIHPSIVIPNPQLWPRRWSEERSVKELQKKENELYV